MREFYEDAVTLGGRWSVGEFRDKADKLKESGGRTGEWSTIKQCEQLAEWAEGGFQVFRMSEATMDAISFTDAPVSFDAPYQTFGFEFPYPILVTIGTGRLSGGDSKPTERSYYTRYGLATRVARGAVDLGNEDSNRTDWWITILNEDKSGMVLDARCELIEVLLSRFCSLLTGGAKRASSPHRQRHALPARRIKAPVNVWMVMPPVKTNLPIGVAKGHLTAGSLPPGRFKLGKRFMVRGHWRNQACGKGMQDRKQLWVAPYLKGPEDGEAWARVYEVD